MTARANDTREGDDYVYTWPDYRVVIVVAEVKESRGEPHGEITLYYQDDDGERVHVTGPTRHTLTGTRFSMLKSAQGRFDNIDETTWKNIIEQAFSLTVQQFRRGDPWQDLSDGPEEIPPRQFLVDPLLPEGETIMLYADGAAGKSYLAMFLALSLFTKQPLADGRLRPGEQPPLDTLYLDWEAGITLMKRRWARACAGLGIPRQPLFYDEPKRPLTHIISQVRRNLHEMDVKSKARGRGGVGLVVIDSIGASIDMEATAAEAATHLFTAARSLGRTVLLLHHMTKEAVKAKGPQEAYGTIYFKLATRNAWEARADDITIHDKEIGIWQRKTNDGGLRPEPLVLHMHFDGERGPVTLTGGRINLASGVDTRRPMGPRLLDALRGGARTLREIAEELELEERQYDTLKSTATRLNKKGLIVKVGGEQWGLATPGGGLPTSDTDDPMQKEVPW